MSQGEFLKFMFFNSFGIAVRHEQKPALFFSLYFSDLKRSRSKYPAVKYQSTWLLIPTLPLTLSSKKKYLRQKDLENPNHLNVLFVFSLGCVTNGYGVNDSSSGRYKLFLLDEELDAKYFTMPEKVS